MELRFADRDVSISSMLQLAGSVMNRIRSSRLFTLYAHLEDSTFMCRTDFHECQINSLMNIIRLPALSSCLCAIQVTSWHVGSTQGALTRRPTRKTKLKLLSASSLMESCLRRKTNARHAKWKSLHDRSIAICASVAYRSLITIASGLINVLVSLTTDTSCSSCISMRFLRHTAQS